MPVTTMYTTYRYRVYPRYTNPISFRVVCDPNWTQMKSLFRLFSKPSKHKHSPGTQHVPFAQFSSDPPQIGSHMSPPLSSCCSRKPASHWHLLCSLHVPPMHRQIGVHTKLSFSRKSSSHMHTLLPVHVPFKQGLSQWGSQICSDPSAIWKPDSHSHRLSIHSPNTQAGSQGRWHSRLSEDISKPGKHLQTFGRTHMPLWHGGFVHVGSQMRRLPSNGIGE